MVGGLTDISSEHEVMHHLKIFKTNFPSLLIRFIMTIDNKYKTSYAAMSIYLIILLLVTHKAACDNMQVRSGRSV